MERAGSFIDPHGSSKFQNNNTIFIWLDILGFSKSLEDESQYEKLAVLLNKFQTMFDENHSYYSRIISDGIILWLKQPDKSVFKKIFREIGAKQLQFTLETHEFIRGGISFGTKLRGNLLNQGNEKQQPIDNFISNGLARAVKIETKEVSWPIIGTASYSMAKIRNAFSVNFETENFGLLKSFNENGGDIYFIDYFEQSEEMLSLIHDKIEESRNDPRIKAKYIWLFRYYLNKFGIQKCCASIEGAVL